MVEERVYKPKLEALNLSQKKLETQIAQTAAAVRRQEGFLPGKTEDPRAHINAISLRSGKVVNSGVKQTPIAENPVDLAGDDEWDAENPRVSIDTIPVSIDTGTVPKEDVEPVKERVYKPKLPYPIIPKLTREEWEAARSKFLSKKMVAGPPVADTPPPLRQLTKREDPGKFSVPCSISRVNFKESLVDSGSSVNVMSRAIAERLKADMRSPNTLLTYADSSSSLPYATILDLPVKIGDCLIPTDFQVVEMSQGSTVPLILGRSFLATVGAIMDTPNKRLSFSFIDRDVFYDVIPSREAPRLVSCITIASGEPLKIEPKVADVSSEPPQHPKKVAGKTKATKTKATSKTINVAANFTLIPQKCDGDSIEYKVKCKGTSKPFSKVRVLIPTEMKAREEDLMSKTLKLEMSGCGVYLGVNSPSCPD